MRILRKLPCLAAALAVLLASALMPAAAQAQASSITKPPLSLTTSPVPLSVVAKPGQTVTADIRIKNNGVQPEKLRIDLLKFGANGETGNPKLYDRGPKDTYFDWVSFPETTFVAESNVWKTVKMTINVPPTAAFDYYLAVVFSRATPDKPTGGASAIEGGVASLVLLSVDTPGAARAAQVATFTASRKVYEFLPADFQIRLKNNGNVHVAPSGNIFINHGGQQVDKLAFNAQQGNILPGTVRAFTASWSDGFPSYVSTTTGNKTTRSLKWDFSKLQKFRFGRYTATLLAVYDNGQRDVPVQAEVSFWVIPWRIIGGALLVLLLIGAGAWFTLRGIWKNVRRPGRRDGDGSASGGSGTEATNEGGKPADSAGDSSGSGGAAPVAPESGAGGAGSDVQGSAAPGTPLLKADKPAAAASAAAQKSRSKRRRRSGRQAGKTAAGSNSSHKPSTAPELKD